MAESFVKLSGQCLHNVNQSASAQEFSFQYTGKVKSNDLTWIALKVCSFHPGKIAGTSGVLVDDASNIPALADEFLMGKFLFIESPQSLLSSGGWVVTISSGTGPDDFPTQFCQWQSFWYVGTIGGHTFKSESKIVSPNECQ